MSDNFKYDVFISYARKDGLAYAERLESELQKAGFTTWRDKRQLDPYQDFSAMIEDALENSSIIVACITPDVQRQDSFVRRELQYALNVYKPIIPLLLSKSARLPIHIVNLAYLDFTISQWEDSFEQLYTRINHIKLGTFSDIGAITPPDDPFREYCNALYKEIVAYLDQTVLSMLPTKSPNALITIRTKEIPDAVPEIVMQEASALPLQFFGMEMEFSHTTPEFTDLPGAFEHYGGRILLLGEAGAGKTTTLFAFARDAVSRRLNDPSEPLPIVLPIISWNTDERPSLLDWIISATPLFKTKRNEVETIIKNGSALLLLDGLDELGDGRETYEIDSNGQLEVVKTYDPRILFIDAIIANDITNKIVVTCRIKDYQDIIGQNGKLPLNGAITLQPLDDYQLQAYLRELPGLWDVLKNHKDLRDIVRTPVLLSMFTFAFSGILRDTNFTDLQTDLLRLTGEELRDEIIRLYRESRYETEETKYWTVGQSSPFSREELDDILTVTGTYIYMQPWKMYAEECATILLKHEWEYIPCLDSNTIDFLLDQRMIVYRERDSRTISFQNNIFLMDYWQKQIYSKLIEYLMADDPELRFGAARGLGLLGKRDCIPKLLNILSNERDPYVQLSIKSALNKLKPEYTIFVSYRRKDWGLTYFVAEKLEKTLDANVFLDRFIDETDFESSILRNLRMSQVFILIVTESTFAPNRIHLDNDWIRKEIVEAMNQNIKLVLVRVDDIRLPSPEQVPENIRHVLRMQAPPIHANSFDEDIQKICDFITTITPIQRKRVYDD